MENHHFQWENPRFLWPFSTVMWWITIGNIWKSQARVSHLGCFGSSLKNLLGIHESWATLSYGPWKVIRLHSGHQTWHLSAVNINADGKWSMMDQLAFHYRPIRFCHMNLWNVLFHLDKPYSRPNHAIPIANFEALWSKLLYNTYELTNYPLAN